MRMGSNHFNSLVATWNMIKLTLHRNLEQIEQTKAIPYESTLSSVLHPTAGIWDLLYVRGIYSLICSTPQPCYALGTSEVLLE